MFDHITEARATDGPRTRAARARLEEATLCGEHPTRLSVVFESLSEAVEVKVVRSKQNPQYVKLVASGKVGRTAIEGESEGIHTGLYEPEEYDLTFVDTAWPRLHRVARGKPLTYTMRRKVLEAGAAALKAFVKNESLDEGSDLEQAILAHLRVSGRVKLRDLHRAMKLGGHISKRVAPTAGSKFNKTLVKLRDTGRVGVEDRRWGEPTFFIAESINEAKMPRPVKGGFTIKGTSRADGVPVDVIKAEVYDNTWALEKWDKGWAVFHVPSGAKAASGRTKKDALKVIMAAYEIAPASEWQFKLIRDFPRDKLNALGSAAKAAQRTVIKSIMFLDSNRRNQTAGIKRDEAGWIKKALKGVVESAKHVAEREIMRLRALSADDGPAGRWSTQGQPRRMRRMTWPDKASGKGNSEIWNHQASYAAHGIERGVDRGFMAKLEKKSKRATMTITETIRRRKAKYKLKVTVIAAEWSDQTNPRKTKGKEPARVVAFYTWETTRVGPSESLAECADHHALRESDRDMRELERKMWQGDPEAQAKLSAALQRMGGGQYWVVVNVVGRYQPAFRTPWDVLPGTTGLARVAAGIYARIGSKAQESLSRSQRQFKDVKVVKASSADDAIEQATDGKFVDA